ncbi:hypothetical protein AOL_s00081g193 [Orbilia oligospora ATCC 24927]|uniref:Peptidase A1 domain-containing protein n=1 Tax=Arthrobotrys oligospora (strain ATCC 24927 / CBS 115.81 / DSM 1491) TaxID=756982 RepID=G1XFQ0_ARTOA|nr:hypothetical protein AOL_s00081g193 [Orbilia oligospora ATCC 24927]EGX47866.1 hypothetical protein AOL_s00081g193 [Orbilia oligospora ATCC 24927]
MLIPCILLLYHLTVATAAATPSELARSTHPPFGQLSGARNHILHKPSGPAAAPAHNRNFRRQRIVRTGEFGANISKKQRPVPGKLKVKSDNFSFFAQIDLGFPEPANLVLDTFSSQSIVMDKKEAAKNGGLLKLPKFNREEIVVSLYGRDIFYSDGSWAVEDTTWYGKISSPASAELDKPASFYGYLALPLRTGNFKRSGKDGVLALAREQSQYSVEIWNEEDPFAPREDSRLPWGAKLPPINGKYPFFTTYLNWREPDKQYLGLGYLEEKELGGSIGTLEVIGADGKYDDIDDWRVKLPEDALEPIIWLKSENLTYAERLQRLNDKDSTVFLLDTKSEYSFLPLDHAIAINEAMGGKCIPIANFSDLPNLITGDYPGSNFQFGGNICTIPCLLMEGKTTFFQTKPITLDLPFGSGYIRIGSDVSLVAYNPWETIWPGSHCDTTRPGNEECVNECLSSIQPAPKNGPNYPSARAKRGSGKENVYGRTIWSNVFAKWDVEGGAVELWDYKGTVRDPPFGASQSIPGGKKTEPKK